MTDEPPHTRSFREKMLRYRGNIDNELYKAEQACDRINGCNHQKDSTTCPFNDPDEPACKIQAIRDILGEHVEHHDIPQCEPRHCIHASWLDGHFLCHSQNECEFQEGAGLTQYCGRSDANALKKEMMK
jgi:hypothetical protein